MKRLLLDQGLPVTAAPILEQHGWDVVHTRNLGMQQASDTEILEYASRASRVVLTLDRDFPQILALTAAARPSVIFIRRQRLRAVDIAELIVSIWREYENALDQGCLLTVSARGIRWRLLPLR
jgi:predicted nuclease of predicted toxin-antitoxin system